MSLDPARSNVGVIAAASRLHGEHLLVAQGSMVLDSKFNQHERSVVSLTIIGL